MALIAQIRIFFITGEQDSIVELSLFIWQVLVMSCLVVIGFFFMVSSLAVFHAYLISRSLTTWEYLSWMKISYMKVWPKKHGSPFDRGGKIENLRFFLSVDFTKSPFLYPWKIPKKLPNL